MVRSGTQRGVWRSRWRRLARPNSSQPNSKNPALQKVETTRFSEGNREVRQLVLNGAFATAELAGFALAVSHDGRSPQLISRESGGYHPGFGSFFRLPKITALTWFRLEDVSGRLLPLCARATDAGVEVMVAATGEGPILRPTGRDVYD